MGIGSRTAAFTCATALLLWSTGAVAQDRFSIGTESVITDASGLRVLTVRDNQSSQCYTLFMTDSPAGAAVPEPAAPDPLEQSVQRIREAAVRRDTQLAKLTTRRNSDIHSGAMPRYEDEVERRRIEDEFQRVLQAEIPSYAWPSTIPGTRSGGWDETTANIQRRAMLDPEPSATMRAMMNQLARLEDLLGRMVQSQRMAASGPVPCQQ
jgi:hypothetical protein